MIEYRLLDKLDKDAVYEEIGVLIEEMYNYMSSKGLSISLPENGGQLFANSIRKMLNTINFIAIAENNKKVVGFLHANIRLLPDYLGGSKTGFISHVYVKTKFREQGIASKLVDVIMKALQKANVELIELDVLIQNENAIKFWERKGFNNELIRMRQKLNPNEYL